MKVTGASGLLPSNYISSSAVPVRTQFLRAVAGVIQAEEGGIQRLDMMLPSGVVAPIDDDDAVLQLKVGCGCGHGAHSGARTRARVCVESEGAMESMHLANKRQLLGTATSKSPATIIVMWLSNIGGEREHMPADAKNGSGR